MQRFPGNYNQNELVDSSQIYNFTNKKPVPENRLNHQITNAKPRRSKIVNQPVNPEELSRAQEALKLLKMKNQQNRPMASVHQNTKSQMNKKHNNSNTPNKIQNIQRPPTQTQQKKSINSYQYTNEQFSNQKEQYKSNQQYISPIGSNQKQKIQKGGYESNIKYNNKNNNNNNNDYLYNYQNDVNQYNSYGKNEYIKQPIYTNEINYNKKNLNFNNIDDQDQRPLDKGNNQRNAGEELNPSQGEPTFSCPDCGRSFARSAYEKHVKICKKVFQKKAKPFDMKQHRILGEDHAEIIRKTQMNEKRNAKINKVKQNQNINQNQDIKGIPKWKKQSEEFRKMLKAGNEPTTTIKGRFNPSQIPSPPPNDDYTFCKFCSRRYNEEAYNKHLQGCERRFKEAQMKSKYSKNTTANSNKYRKK